MEKMIWLEWVGIWGSGKSRCIQKLFGSIHESELKLDTTKDFFIQNKFMKMGIIFSGSWRTFFVSLKIIVLLIPYFLKAYRQKDSIKIDVFRSFLSCYFARISSRITCKNSVLWEGELHLIPLLGLSYYSLSSVIDLLVTLNKDRTYAVVVMVVDESIALQRILSDADRGINKRFKEGQKITIERLREFKSSQDQLIEYLREKGIRVFESDGELKTLKDFIRTL